MNPLNVLVCGTNYGRIYLEAVGIGGAGYRLAGILARGSARSHHVARQYGVPLYGCVEDLAPGIDLACAAVGLSGFHVVLSLLAQGIHVLCEHPQPPSGIRSALDSAASRNLCFHVNGHFADLKAARAFIHHCRRQSEAAPLCFLHVMATDRSLYAAVDILRRALVSFAPSEFHVTSRLPPFTIVQGLLGGVPVAFHLQHSADGRRVSDGSPAYVVDHRIAAGFRSGILTLQSMSGPVVWNANQNCSVSPAEPLFRVFHAHRALTAGLLYQERTAANLAAIAALAKNMREHVTPPEQSPEYLLEVSRTWQTIGDLL